MKRKRFKKLSELVLAIVILCCFNSKVAAQYSEKAEPVSPEALVKAQQILKPPVKLLSFSHFTPDHIYHPTLGAFCILENKIEKKAKMPVKMRLGSVDYVNKLEQKGQ